jgi:hypothetical protein
MTPSSPFEILRRDPSTNASAKFTPANGFDPVPRGFALGAHATDPDSFDVAQHNTFIGHLTRQVRVSGLTLTDRVFGVTSDTPVGVEAPFTAGQEVSLEKAKEIELEGSAYIVTSGARDVTAATVGQQLSFKDGLLGKTQASELANYVLTATGLTPNVQGALRIRAEKV